MRFGAFGRDVPSMYRSTASRLCVARDAASAGGGVAGTSAGRRLGGFVFGAGGRALAAPPRLSCGLGRVVLIWTAEKSICFAGLGLLAPLAVSHVTTHQPHCWCGGR